MVLRQYLVDLREQRNETQQDVANVLGVSRQYYAMIENAQRQKNLDLMVMTSLAQHFGMSLAAIAKKELAYIAQSQGAKV